jgi:hypothetical protein
MTGVEILRARETMDSPEPQTLRPHMPGYGVSASLEGALPWSWAVERLSRAQNYFVATVWPDGRPHVTAVWAVWVNGRLCFSCGPSSRKARNLAANPECVVTTERADELVIVEGAATPITDDGLLSAFLRAYKEKYDWDPDPSSDALYAVRPRAVFGFIEHQSQFAQAATKWVFEEEQ